MVMEFIRGVVEIQGLGDSMGQSQQLLICVDFETSLKWLTVAMPFLKIRERDLQETRERQERDESMADGLTSTNKIATKS